MAITNLYPNLPGHLVEFKDGGLTTIIDDRNKSGKSLLLLGTAFDGPLMEPVRVTEDTVAHVFGDDVDVEGYPNGATLTKYAKQAFKAGFNDVRCMRVTGTPAEVEIVKSEAVGTEEVDCTQGINVSGNAETVITVQHTPMVSGSLAVKVDSANISATPTYSPVNGKLTFPADFGRQYAKLSFTYKSYDISEVEEQNITAAGGDTITLADMAAVKTYVGDDTLTKDIYYTPDIVPGQTGSTNGIVEVVDDGGKTLVEGTDYTVTETGATASTTGKAVSITLDAGFSGTSVNIKVKVATKVDHTDEDEDASGNEYELAGSYDGQVIAAGKPITAGTLTIAGMTEGVDYDYTANGITLHKSKNWVRGSYTVAYTTTVDVVSKESFLVKSIYGGTAYNAAKVELKKNTDGSMRITFTKPESKKINSADAAFYYDTPGTDNNFVGVKNVGMLRDQLQNYDANNVFEIVCDDDELDLATFPEGIYQLSGGTDGVNPTMDEMFVALAGDRYDADDVANGRCQPEDLYVLKEQGAFQILENYHVDYIIPVGVYADVVPAKARAIHSSFHNELAKVCAVLTYRTKMTHGFIDMKPNNNTTLKGVQKYVEKLLKYDNIHYMQDLDGNILKDSDGNKMDIGWYTSLVVGPEPIYISDNLGRYAGSPAIGYAALNSTIAAESAPTHKAIPNAVGMKYAFSNKQMNELVGNRMVCFMALDSNSAARNSVPYVCDGCTSGAPNSDYGRMSTVKVVTDVVDQVREVCAPFLGEPNTREQRNAMSSLIAKRLSYLLEQGEILHYEFRVDATQQEVMLGECSITLELVCPQELRKIKTTVALRAAA